MLNGGAAPLFELDMSLFKKTQITERVAAEFRVEGFNILNRANFATPGLSDLYSGGAPSTSAGSIAATSTSSRQLQFGLKILFLNQFGCAASRGCSGRCTFRD